MFHVASSFDKCFLVRLSTAFSLPKLTQFGISILLYTFTSVLNYLSVTGARRFFCSWSQSHIAYRCWYKPPRLPIGLITQSRPPYNQSYVNYVNQCVYYRGYAWAWCAVTPRRAVMNNIGMMHFVGLSYIPNESLNKQHWWRSNQTVPLLDLSSNLASRHQFSGIKFYLDVQLFSVRGYTGLSSSYRFSVR